MNLDAIPWDHLPGKSVSTVYGSRSKCPSVSGHGAALSPLSNAPGRPLRILYSRGPHMPARGQVSQQEHTFSNFIGRI